ncbi:hypothetical protein [Amphritea sp.]|uniref:hypothetical protein n=1 Tax=Amphritea sp. TaxID=1872502 RepID=UPI0025C4CE65|nr:hypothetical protein [Amphritea sp.]
MLRSVIFSLCAAALLYGLFRETPPPKLFDQSDKFGHLIGFAAMTFIAIWTIPRKYIALFMVGLLALACSAEFLQEWLLPHRHFSLNDMYANLTGIAIILLPWIAWRIKLSFFLNSSKFLPSEKQQ